MPGFVNGSPPESGLDGASALACVPMLSCVNLPAFPLQVLLRRETEWAGGPVAVVAEDRPQGRVLWANEEARRLRVLPGQRYAAALALARDLRAGVVPDDEIRRAVDETTERLRRFSPHIEPSRDEPGVFWIDAAGLAHLHPDLRAWAEAIRADLAATGLAACVVVGVTRFGTYAIARALAARLLPTERASSNTSSNTSSHTAPRAATTVVLLPDAATEQRALRRVPLDRLGIAPDVRDLLAKLGVRTVDQFIDLPAAGVRARFGDAAHRLHRLAAGQDRPPLAPEPPQEPIRASVVLEYPESDGVRLLFIAKRLLDPLLFRAAERREAVAGISLRLRLEGGGECTDVLRAATPTLDGVQLIDLLRLRLEGVRLVSGAIDVELTAQTLAATAAQLTLFAERPKRDLAAADRALARLRAEFGEDSVVRARLRDAHLPEATFAWVPFEHTQLPRARAASRPPLVRRLLARPRPLPPRPRHEPDGWMLRGFEHGNVIRIEGPYVVAGGWWAGDEVRREYHFAETSRGRLFWVFYDVRRRRWFLQGEVS